MGVIVATPTKLHSGEWGARVQGQVAKGDVVTVTTSKGKRWDAVVTHVVWKGDGISIVATESNDRRRRSRGTWTGCYCGSVEEYERNSDCVDCRRDR